MTSRPIRIYADTSVFGGVFDEEFQEASRLFFDDARNGKFRIVVSEVVLDEIRRGPAKVRELIRDLGPWTEGAEVSEEALQLVNAYLSAAVLTE